MGDIVFDSDVKPWKGAIMQTSRRMGNMGGSIIAWFLRRKGYAVSQWGTGSEGATDIKASRGNRNVLVQVRTSCFPAGPDSAPREETNRVLLRAAWIGAEAWQANLQMFRNGTLVPPIQWRRVL